MTVSERVKTTAHARQRMEEMGLTRRDILEPFHDPTLDYPVDADRYGPNCRVAVKGDLAVAYDAAKRRVITVLWHRKDSRHG